MKEKRTLDSGWLLSMGLLRSSRPSMPRHKRITKREWCDGDDEMEGTEDKVSSVSYLCVIG